MHAIANLVNITALTHFANVMPIGMSEALTNQKSPGWVKRAHERVKRVRELVKGPVSLSKRP